MRLDCGGDISPTSIYDYLSLMLARFRIGKQNALRWKMCRHFFLFLLEIAWAPICFLKHTFIYSGVWCESHDSPSVWCQLHVIILLYYFLFADKSNLVEKGLTLPHSSMWTVSSIVVGKSRKQELEAAGQITFTVRKETGRNACLLFSSLCWGFSPQFMQSR